MLSIYKLLWICPNEQISPESNLQAVCFDYTVVIHIWLICSFQVIMSTLFCWLINFEIIIELSFIFLLVELSRVMET